LFPSQPARFLYRVSASEGFPAINNTDVILAFQEAWFDTVVSLDVNDRLSSDITPEWPSYRSGNDVMLFNVTETGAANITVVGPDSALLQRCE
jgi:hypothetical protein